MKLQKMKMTVLSSLILLAVLCIPGLSQAGGKGISPEKSRDIERLLDLTITDAFIESWTNSFTQLFIDAASIDRNSEDQKELVIIFEAARDVVVAEFPSLKEEFIPIYDEFYTHAEVKKLVEFYQSPTGKKTIKVMPQLTQRGMALGQQWGEGLAPKIDEAIKKKGVKFRK